MYIYILGPMICKSCNKINRNGWKSSNFLTFMCLSDVEIWIISIICFGTFYHPSIYNFSCKNTQFCPNWMLSLAHFFFNYRHIFIYFGRFCLHENPTISITNFLKTGHERQVLAYIGSKTMTGRTFRSISLSTLHFDCTVYSIIHNVLIMSCMYLYQIKTA